MSNLIYVSTRTHKAIHDAYDKSPQAKKEMQERLLAALALNPSIGGGLKKFEAFDIRPRSAFSSEKMPEMKFF